MSDPQPKTCHTCMHFYTSDAFGPHGGLCQLELPPYIVLTRRNEWGLNEVLKLESCSFWAKEET